jgi:gamma-glutamyl:cysteine ligase YbdK (ATP-grasp superfamily)
VKAAVLEVSPEEWQAMAVGVIAMYADRREPFTAEDVRHHMDESPHHANAWGAAFRAAQARGIITPTGYTQSHLRSRRNGVQRVWIGVERKHRD